MRRNVPVSHRIACWQQLSPLAKVEPEVGERLVARPHIEHLTSYYILGSAGANGATEGLDLANGVRILVKSLLAERSQEVESSMLIEMLLEGEFVWASVQVGLNVHYLLLVRLHWRNWAEGRHHSLETRASRLESHLHLVVVGDRLVLFVRHHRLHHVRHHVGLHLLQLTLIHIVQVRFLQIWIGHVLLLIIFWLLSYRLLKFITKLIFHFLALNFDFQFILYLSEDFLCLFHVSSHLWANLGK